MKLKRIAFAGFRGALAKVDLEVPAGFLVITGRNGAGKSTICDAIEFALTGTIRADSDHKEKGERISDYIWWRGAAVAVDRYVELELEDSDGKVHSIRRTPDSQDQSSTLADLLCNDPSGVVDPLRQLCRTAVMRDEEITRLSVDLKETERFDFVQSVLGTAAFSSLEERASELFKLARKRAEDAERDYVLNRDRVNQAAARLSAVKSQAAPSQSPDLARDELASTLQTEANRRDLLDFGTNAAKAERSKADTLLRYHATLSRLVQEAQEILSAPFQKMLQASREREKNAEHELRTTQQNEDEARARLAVQETEKPKLSALSQVIDYGQRYGLEDGECPLCGASHSEEKFMALVKERAETLRLTNEAFARAARAHADAMGASHSARSAYSKARMELDRLTARQVAFVAAFEGIRLELQQVGFDLGQPSEAELARLGEAADGARSRVALLERNLSALRWANDTSRELPLEKDLESARKSCSEAEARFAKASGAADKAKQAVDAIRRARGELVDERLGELTPLLTELYQRLRPSLDYPEVAYRLRGEVRKMLSFEVSGGLNPSFLFSSGQRRAAGLAFLLAIHLSRRWCKLDALILDDPVQHVDDYRALHLVEVLSAIRRAGRQVVCTVEDTALADLMARRLRSEPAAPGAVVEMEYVPGGGSRIGASRAVPPPETGVLLNAS